MSQQLITSNEISSSANISAGQITSVNSNVIVGLITANQISNIANTQIVGVILPPNGTITSAMLDTASANGSGAMVIPTGTTAQRPSIPLTGQTLSLIHI